MRNFVSIFLILISTMANAGEIIETHHNVRANGMGGVYMSIVNDSNAIFVNPAALGRTSGMNLQVMNVEAGINGKDIYDEFRGIDTSDPNSFNQFFGKDVWIRAGGKAAFSLPYLGVGVYSDTQTHLVLHNPAFPQFDTTFLSDYGLIVSGAFPVGPMSYGGVSLKRISRWGGQQDIDLGVIASGNLSDVADQFKNKGNGYGVDLAAMTTLPMPFSPTFSLVWQDVGSTAFTKSDGLDAPPRIHDNLSLGMSTSLDLPGLDWVAGFEYRHITESEYPLGQKLHFGTEFSLPFIDIRGGINQGYATYGAGINLFFIKLDAAMYTEETGAYPGQTPQNRVEIGLSLDLAFDADFKLMSADGKKRKLKQRR